MTTILERGEGSVSGSGRFLPPEKTRYPLYRRLGEPQGRSGQAWKISPTLGFDPRTVQPVASRYTERSIWLIINNVRLQCEKQGSFNLLKLTGHVMHHQFNIQQLYALPILYLCVLYLSENKQ